MKRLAMLMIGTALYLSTETPTTIYIPADTQFVMIPDSAVECPICSVDITTGTVYLPPPAVSTGPFYMKASTGDCYRVDAINPNGTTIPPGPFYPYAACPQ